MLEIKISCACAINRLVNISLQLFGSKYVRIRLQTSISSFFKNFQKPTVNFGSYWKHNTWEFLKPNGNLTMNDKVRAAQRSGSKSGPLGAFSGKSGSSWHSVLADLYEGSNRGEYLGFFSSSLVYLSGFGRDITFELHDWLPDIFIAIDLIIEHSTGMSVDKETLTQWLTMDLSPFIDLQHSDAVGLYIPLSQITNFSYSGPQSDPEDNSDTAPAFHIVPQHIIDSLMRFRTRTFSVQALTFSDPGIILSSSNLGAIRGIPSDQYDGGALTSTILNLLMQYFQSATSTDTWILLIRVQIRKFTSEIFGVVKSHAESSQQGKDRHSLSLDLSVPKAFSMTPLTVLLAPDVASARVAADHLSLPESFSVLKIKNLPRGQSVRALLAQLAADSTEGSLEGIRMVWIHRERMTARLDAKYQMGDTLYLHIPGGYRPEGLHCGQEVNPNPSSHKSILPPEPCAAYATLRTSLLYVNPTGQSGRGRGRVAGRGHAGRPSGVKPPANISPSTIGGFTEVKSKSTKLAERISTWGGQANLPTLLGIPSLSKTRSSLIYAPKPPPPILPPSFGGTTAPCYDPTAFPPLTTVEETPDQWKVLDQKDSEITQIVHPSSTDLDGFDPLPTGLANRCQSLGISDRTSALLAYRAARTQILLCHSTYPSWKKLLTPLAADFFLESRYLAPPLTGGQRIPQLAAITKKVEARCAIFGATKLPQVRAILTVLQEQYRALLQHWKAQHFEPPAEVQLDYVPHFLRLTGTALLNLVKGVLPIKFGSIASTEVAALGHQLGVPSDLHVSLGLLIQFLLAETALAAFPPGGVRTAGVEFQNDSSIPWLELGEHIPPAIRWTISPDTLQHLRMFKVYSVDSARIILRTLVWVETAVDWSRRHQGDTSRGCFIPEEEPLSPGKMDLTQETGTFPELDSLCTETGLPTHELLLSLEQHAYEWSGIGTTIATWETDPEYLPWNVYEHDTLFALLQRANVAALAEDIYRSIISLPSKWTALLADLIHSVPYRPAVIFSATPSDDQRNSVNYLFESINDHFRDFLVISILQRPSYWRRAVKAVRAWAKEKPAQGEAIVRTMPRTLQHNIWALGVHTDALILSTFTSILQQPDKIEMLIDLLHPEGPDRPAPYITEDSLKLGGAFPAGEFYRYVPPHITMGSSNMDISEMDSSRCTDTGNG